MDAVAPPEPTVLPPVPVSAERRAAVLLDALRAAAGGGEHRLFRGGKLPGLFPARTGPVAEIALEALADGLLETVRTEARGKVVTEWVRATPKGVRRLHDTDSPQAALVALKDAVADARGGVAAGLTAAKAELAALGERFDRDAGELTARLDALTARLEAALRRADLSAVAGRVAWGATALHYLDCRPGATCPLAELFRAVGGDHPGLSLADFHAGLVALADARAVRLVADGPPGEPEYALLVGPTAYHAAAR